MNHTGFNIKISLCGAILIALLCISLHAQQPAVVGASVEVEGKGADYDTLDYGYVLVTSVTKTYPKSVDIICTGDSSIQIPLGERPYFVLESVNAREEFINAFNTFPFRVSQAEKVRKYNLPFLPSNIAVQSPAGYREAKAIFSVRSDADTSKVVLLDTIILKAVKSFTPLWSDEAIVNFDSVYINATLPKRKTWLLRNLDLDNPAISVDTVSFALFPQSNASLRFTNQTIQTVLQPDVINPYQYSFDYAPKQIGRDIKTYTFRYNNAQSGARDSIKVELQGVGVEQKIQAVNALPRRVLLRGNGDTVDIGDVRINTTDTIRIVFENKGNISVHARTTSVEDITPLIRQTYSVVRGISARADVTPNGYDTLTIAFSPVSEGESFARIVMQTDIQSRVSGVPEAAANPSIVVRAFGTRAKLQYLQSSVQYDSVPVFQECYSERKRTVTVRNQGNAILRVTSLVIQPLQSPYSVTQAPFDLQPNQTQSFDVIFSPRTVSTFNSQLLVYTSDSDQPYSLPLSGRGVPADVSDISLPDGITYFPGHAVRIPIIAKASALGVTKDFTTTIRFDSSMLKYSTFSTTNTASTSATVNISEQVRGQLTCSISMPANSRFRAVDTLIWLVFDSYLGYAAETETILINPQLGTENCTSALPLRVTNGVVAVDSLCGLVYKIPKRRAKFSSYIVESSDGIDIVSTLPFAMPLHYRVITMTGETVAEESIVTAKEGENRLHITTSRFAAGVYYLVITAEHLKGTVQFAITR